METASATREGLGDIGARLDQLSASRAIWTRVVLLSLGGCFEYYDLFLTGYVAPGLVRSGVLTPTTPGLFGTSGVASFVAALFAGLFVGTALFGFVADRFGRKTIFTYSLIWYAVASVVMAFQTDAFGLNLWRFIAGVGIGVELVTIDAYIAELVPAALRGRAFAYNSAIQFVAVPVVAFLAWLLVPNAPLGMDGWRWVVLIGSLGAVFVWWIRRGVPESPRWLAQHGRLEEADRALSALEGAKPSIALPTAPAGETNPQPGRFGEIWRSPYLARTVMLIIFNIFQTVGFYGFSNWVPTLLIEQGISITKSLQYTFIIAIAAPFGPLIASALGDKVERKWLIVVAAFAIAVFGIIFGQTTAAVPLIALGVLLTLSNNILSFAFHGYQAELYPTRIRAMAVGFVYSWSRLSVVFSAFLIADTLHWFGVAGVFTLIAGSMGIVMVSIGALGPRTSNLSLDAISK
ncbi:MFS transporter [Methylocapsa sp. S129]|uniref:MFS transporter n=1 Tax=Methylocapsa sp. S129 TaxID=1641869 RepID=UPI00131E5FE9|nr:MFS transporter [Methylocapsa sp. S129]